MGTKIKSTMQVEVTGAATIARTHALEVEAYDKIEITVPAGAGGVDVDVQPGGAGQVQLLLITASDYGAGVEYEVDASGDAVALDSPQMFVGAGSVGLLGAVQTISFTNPDASDVDVMVIVGRDATP